MHGKHVNFAKHAQNYLKNLQKWQVLLTFDTILRGTKQNSVLCNICYINLFKKFNFSQSQDNC